jgi:8-oxo-dGTP pyrophosphatase MutT (NUDIX family)
MPDAEGETPPKWQVLAVSTLISDRWFRLDRERVRTSAEHVIEGWYLGHSLSWTCAVAAVPDGRVVTIEQYRRGPDAWVIEIPAGNIEPDEAPADCAVRELAEESGYRAIAAPTALGRWWPEPAHNSAAAHGFAVRVAAEAGPQTLDLGEDMRVRLRTPAEVEEAISAGRFCHAAQIGFWYAARARGLA